MKSNFDENIFLRETEFLNIVSNWTVSMLKTCYFFTWNYILMGRFSREIEFINTVGRLQKFTFTIFWHKVTKKLISQTFLVGVKYLFYTLWSIIITKYQLNWFRCWKLVIFFLQIHQDRISLQMYSLHWNHWRRRSRNLDLLRKRQSWKYLQRPS